MACGVLTDAGTPYIYCVGGSAGGATVATGRVFRYDPVPDVVSAVAAPWPQGSVNILPGGFTIFQNKLYILGGFDIPGGNATNQIWEFTPGTNAWVQKVSVLPVPRGYLPTTTIGTLIFTGGGSAISAGALTDTTDSFVYNPVGDSIGTIANIPRATGETRALTLNGKMWVLGGGRIAPNPSTEVDIYDPVAGTWTTGLPFVTPRRNFPTATDGSRIWLGGGYTTDGLTPQNTMEIFTGGAPVATSVVSRKAHGAFNGDINLPLTGSPGIECRNTGGTQQIIFTFVNPVTVSGSTTPPPSAATLTGTGAVSNITVVSNVVTVNLTGVTDVQQILLTLLNVSDGSNSGDVPVPMKVLIGDSAGIGSSSVNSSDVSFVKSKSGAAVIDATNFRADVATNGIINSSDVGLVKSKSGNSLP